MPFVSGFLTVRRRGGHPDQGLPPGEGPVDPGYGVGEEGPDQGLPPLSPGLPDQGLPPNPPGIWPPLTPSHPIQPAPGVPPGAIWPPVNRPVDPGYGVGDGAHPGQGLPGSPPAPGQGLPPTTGGGRPDQGLPSRTFWVVAGIPGVGWRYVCVDPDAHVPSHPIARPPTAQPK